MKEFQEKSFCLVKPAEASLKPSSTGCPVRVFVHSDKITCGTFVIPPRQRLGRISAHGGDEVYYVERGRCTISFPRWEQVVVVNSGEMLYIPAGAIHQAINDADEEVVVVWCAAPDWP